MRRTRRLAMAGAPAPKAQARPAPAGQDLPAGQAEARQARGQAHEGTAGKIAAAYREQEGQQRVRREAGARAEAEEPAAESADGNRAAGQPDPPVQPAAKAGTTAVTFTLPVDVQAESVALWRLADCGWSGLNRTPSAAEEWRGPAPGRPAASASIQAALLSGGTTCRRRATSFQFVATLAGYGTSLIERIFSATAIACGV